MSEEQKPQSEIGQEIESLASNMRQVLQAIWEREERKQVQKEIQVGLAAFGAAMNELLKDFQEGATADRIREEVDDLGERIRSGETAQKAQSNMVDILRKINADLERAGEKVKSSPQATEPESEVKTGDDPEPVS